MLRLTIKGLLAHKLRVALTALAIVLGVTFVTGTLVFTDTLRNSFTSLFSNIYSHVDFEVRGKAAFSDSQSGSAVRPPISDALIGEVRAVPGVAAAEGLVGGYAQFVAKDGKAITTGGAPSLGVTFVPDPAMSALHLVDGKRPTTGTQVAMDEGTATKYHFAVGDQVRVLLPTSARSFTITGIVRFGSAANLGGATIAAFDLATAQRSFGEEGKVDAIELTTTSGADKAKVERAVAKVLPPGAEIAPAKQVADEQSSAINNALGFFSTALLVFALISLFVGGFTILNTFSITVGQRTRELALLRIVGASRRQVFWSVLLEATVIGLLASVVGLAAGVAMATGLEALLKTVGLTLPSGGLIFAGRTVVIGLLVGTGVTVISSISPARRAVRIPPIAALQSVQAANDPGSRRRSIVGALLALIGAAILVLGLAAPQLSLVGLGALLLFIGVGMLSPLVARPISSVIGRPLVALRGVPGRLGRQNSMRSPRRTAQTAAALMVGLALVATMAVFGASLSRSATVSVSNAISADYIAMPSSQGGPTAGFSAGAVEVARGLPGVTAASPIYAAQAKVGKSVHYVTGLSPSDVDSTVTLRMAEGDGRSALASGGLLVDSNTAKKDKLAIGDERSVTFAAGGTSRLKVSGIFKPNVVLGSYLVGAATFHQYAASSTLPVVLLIATDSPANPKLSAELTKGLKSFPNLKVQTRAEFEKAQEAQVNQLLTLVYALLALAIIIALIGIVNTLMLSVFERTREIGLLRAVGMSRRQVRSMIRTESVILSVFGAIIGVLLGTGLGIALVTALKEQGITELVIPWGSLLVFLLLAALLGLAAASWPARRAARLNVLDAIATE